MLTSSWVSTFLIFDSTQAYAEKTLEILRRIIHKVDNLKVKCEISDRMSPIFGVENGSDTWGLDSIVYVSQGASFEVRVREGVSCHCPSIVLQVVMFQRFNYCWDVLSRLPGKVSFTLPSANEVVVLVSKSLSVINICSSISCGMLSLDRK